MVVAKISVGLLCHPFDILECNYDYLRVTTTTIIITATTRANNSTPLMGEGVLLSIQRKINPQFC